MDSKKLAVSIIGSMIGFAIIPSMVVIISTLEGVDIPDISWLFTPKGYGNLITVTISLFGSGLCGFLAGWRIYEFFEDLAAVREKLKTGKQTDDTKITGGQ